MANYAAADPYVRDLLRLESRLRVHIRQAIDAFQGTPQPTDKPTLWLALGGLQVAANMARDSDELGNAVDAARKEIGDCCDHGGIRAMALACIYNTRHDLAIKADQMRRAVFGDRY